MSGGYQAAWSFTVQYNGLARQLTVDVGLSEAYDPDSGLPPPSTTRFISIWDTGASASAISNKVVAALNLKPIGITQMQTAGGVAFAYTYLVNIYLPNGVAFKAVRVTEAQLLGEEDVLVGMDIIGQGDLSITNTKSRTCMSFRIPSLRRIDYVEENNRMKKVTAFQNPDQRRLRHNKRKRARQNR